MTRFLAPLALLFLIAAPAAAQVGDTAGLPTGVRLGLIYQPGFSASIAVRPFEASTDGAAQAAAQAASIVRRDLDYSDRFEVAELPSSLTAGAVDYGPLNELNLVYLVTGQVETDGAGYLLRVTLHDVVYRSVKENRVFRLPAPSSPEFRMAVHAASDAVVEWVTGQPGMAATRIAFVRRNAGGRYDLMLVDYDGENLRSVAATDEILLSPAWAPGGGRIAYSIVTDEGRYQIHERDLASGEVFVVAERGGLTITPAYSNAGDQMAFAAATEDGGTDLFSYDAGRRCCMARLEGGRGRELSPTYSADGQRFAFNSDRIGQPHIYVRETSGGQPVLISPFVYGEPGYYTSPDWSPVGSLIAFHGRSRGNFQIMVADANRPGAVVQQVTAEGVSEDPSWAPDGRHVVFAGWRDGGRGLYVIDTVSGRIRPLVLGGDLLVPDWSPTLVRASELALDGR